MESLNKLISTIQKRIASCHNKIISFSETTYSYEEWINWEIYDALIQAGYFGSLPKPFYPYYEKHTTTRRHADIYVEDVKQCFKAFIEVSLVGEATQKKWLGKIKQDSDKLSTFKPKDRQLKKIQLLILVANQPKIHDRRKFQSEWLEKLEANGRIIKRSSSKSSEIILCFWDIAK